MTCRDVRLELADLARGRLPRKEVELLTRHLDACQVCRGEFEELRATFALFERYQPSQPPSVFWESQLLELRKRIEASPARQKPLALQPRWILAYAAAAGVILLVALWALRQLPEGAPGEPVAPSEVWARSAGAAVEELVASLTSPEESEQLMEVLAGKLPLDSYEVPREMAWPSPRYQTPEDEIPVEQADQVLDELARKLDGRLIEADRLAGQNEPSYQRGYQELTEELADDELRLLVQELERSSG